MYLCIISPIMTAVNLIAENSAAALVANRAVQLYNSTWFKLGLELTTRRQSIQSLNFERSSVPFSTINPQSGDFADIDGQIFFFASLRLCVRLFTKEVMI